VKHDSTKFFEKAILLKISIPPDRRMPLTAMVTGVNQVVTLAEPLP
jgi:hypothetical protein